MEDKEILEGNKLIAEFEELKYLGKDLYGFSGDVFMPKEYDNEILCSINTQSMKYHSSWNWLMPVVEKIESLGHPVYISSNTCIIYEHTGKDHGWNIDSYSSSKIESCWLACVHFAEKLINNKK